VAEWRRSKGPWRVYVVAYAVQALAMIGFWSLRLYGDYTGAKPSKAIEGVLLTLGLGSLAIALASGFAALRTSRSPLRWVFVAAGAVLALGTFVGVFALSRP
jgi:hypothetical protein